MVIDLLCMLPVWSFIYNLSFSLSLKSNSQYLNSQKILKILKLKKKKKKELRVIALCLLLQSKPEKHEKVFDLVLGESISLFTEIS